MVRIAQFGKLPARGDFIATGMDAALEARWLSWQREGFAAERKDGPVSVADYLDGPAWAFAARPQAFGSGPLIGVTAPCRDGIGRSFAMSVFGLLEGGIDPLTLIGSNGRWFLDAYELLCQRMAAGPGAPLDSFDARLSDLAAPDPRPLPEVFALDADDPGLAMLRLMLDGDAGAVCSLWWTAGPDATDQSIALCTGPSDTGLWQRLYRTPASDGAEPANSGGARAQV